MKNITLAPFVDGEPDLVLPVVDIPKGETEVVTADGRYFMDAESMVNHLHTVLHSLMDLADAHPETGYDTEAFSTYGHIIVNHIHQVVSESMDAIAMSLGLSDDALEKALQDLATLLTDDD